MSITRVLACLLAVATAVPFACSDARAQSSAPPLVTVRLGMIPIVTQAPVFLGQERGFFKDEGLNVNIHMFQGGPEITAAVIGGDIDFGYANTVSPILAFVQGAPVRIVAPSDIANDSVVNGVLVKRDSPIKSIKGLVGKRVAVNALKGILELVVREGVQRDGGDQSKVVFVEVPFPQMGSVLASGQVDAVVNVEPFISSMVAGDARVLSNVFAVIKGGPGGIWFASAKKSQDKELLARFRRAIERSNVYAAQHTEEVRRVIQTFTRIGPDAASNIALPTWSPVLPLETVQQQIDMLVRYGFMKKNLNASDILVN